MTIVSVTGERPRHHSLRRVATTAIATAVATASLAWIAMPPARAAVERVERQRVIDQVDTVGRRGFLFEVTSPVDPDPSLRRSSDAAARAERSGVHRLFLYGTIHLGRVGSEPFNPAVVAALRASCRLALEADPTDQATVRRLTIQLGRYDDDDALQRHLSPALMARVTKYGEGSGLAVQQLARLKPWLLVNMLTLRDFSAVGLDPALGSELYLSGFARARGMPVVEIEGIEAQLRLLSGLPDAMQAAQLDEALDDMESVANGSDHGGRGGADDGADEEALFDLWLNGDADAADEFVVRLHREAAARAFGREFVETLIDARNRSMADRAEREMRRPGPSFFAVGALHLFGPAGLVAELRRRGYRVADLQAKAPTVAPATRAGDAACPSR